MFRRPVVQLAVLLLVCAAVYWPALGAGGLADTEGHRVIPSWAMLDGGQWLVPELFDQTYLRKPPGVNWAIAGGSAVFGQSELGARAFAAICSTLMALVAWIFAGRWFGWRFALSAGLAQALMPWLWSSGRHAEIEALNNLGTQLAAFLLIDTIVRTNPHARLVRAVLIGGAVALVGLAKGPASAPVLIGVVAGACIARGSFKPVRSPTVWIGLLFGVGLLVGLGLATLRMLDGIGQEPVLQSPSAFMFEPRMFARIVLLGPTALVSMLPASLALLFPWGPDARTEADSCEGGMQRWQIARALSWSVLIALGIYTIIGTGNPRYTLPVAVLVAPAVAWAVRGVFEDESGSFTALRARIGRRMLLGSAWVWPIVLVAGAWVYIGTVERDGRATSGRQAGRAIAAMLAQEDLGSPVEIHADGIIEARPETLLYAQRAMLDEYDTRLVVRWMPGVSPDKNGGLWVLRTDELGNELGRLTRDYEVIGEGTVHKYRFAVVRVESDFSP